MRDTLLQAYESLEMSYTVFEKKWIAGGGGGY